MSIFALDSMLAFVSTVSINRQKVKSKAVKNWKVSAQQYNTKYYHFIDGKKISKIKTSKEHVNT